MRYGVAAMITYCRGSAGMTGVAIASIVSSIIFKAAILYDVGNIQQFTGAAIKRPGAAIAEGAEYKQYQQ